MEVGYTGQLRDRIRKVKRQCANCKKKNFICKGLYIVKYMSAIVQQDATIYSLFISVNCSTYFGWYLHQSSGAHVTVSTASGISKTVTATSRERDWTGTGVPVHFWWWVEIPPETCRAVYRHKWTVYSCILLDNYWHMQNKKYGQCRICHTDYDNISEALHIL